MNGMYYIYWHIVVSVFPDVTMEEFINILFCNIFRMMVIGLASNNNTN